MPAEMLKSTISIDIDEFLNLLAADVTPEMICNLCGGKGHAASFYLKNGTKQLCATKIARMENGVDSAKSMSVDQDDDGDCCGSENKYDFEAMANAINSLNDELAHTQQL